MKPFKRTGRPGYYADYKNEHGKRVIFKAGNSYESAIVRQSKLQQDANLIRDGIISRRDIEAGKNSLRPICEIIIEYREYLRAKGNSKQHIKEAIRCINAISEGINSKNLSDINLKEVEAWLANLVDRGRSHRTRNCYLIRIRGMLNWAVKRSMLKENPLVVIDILPEQIDKREVSRAMTPEEFNRLLQNTPDKKRRLYYLFAGRTGLRWSEIIKIRWQDINLESGWLTINAFQSKSKRSEDIPLSDDLIISLKQCPKRIGHLFDTKPQLKTFKNDLRRAAIEYDNMHGQIDRKSLRKMFGTHLAMAGVDLRVTQRLMRHSDPRLTSNIYTDPYLINMKDGVNKLLSLNIINRKEGCNG